MEKRNSRPIGLRKELRKCITATVKPDRASQMCILPHGLFFIVLETGARNPPEVKVDFTICQDITCHSSANVICFHAEFLNLRV